MSDRRGLVSSLLWLMLLGCGAGNPGAPSDGPSAEVDVPPPDVRPAPGTDAGDSPDPLPAPDAGTRATDGAAARDEGADRGDATPFDGGASPSGPMKGVAFNDKTTDCADLATLKVAWFYNWTGAPKCPGVAAQFVPQIWGSWVRQTWVPTPETIAAAGHKEVLGFNEPDHVDQANMTVAEALGLWARMSQPGLRVGSPATATDGKAWFEQFMAGAQERGLRVDFVAVHWYGWTAGSCASVTGLENHIKWAERWKRPIWITEWGCRQQSATITQAFYQAALKMFARHPLVERYAWYLSRSTGDFAGAALIDGAGQLTAFGRSYAAAPRE